MATTQNKLEVIIKQYSPEQLRLIMRNVGAIQLTDGCNTACPDCGLGALPGVRDYIAYETLEWMFREFKEELGVKDKFRFRRPFLYFASEPFDYFDGKHDYVDVHTMFGEITGINPSVVTSVPKGKQKEIVKYILNGNSITKGKMFIDAISITSANKRRIELVLLEEIPLDQQVQLKSKYRIRKIHTYTDFKNDRITSSEGGATRRWVLLNYYEIAQQLGINNKRLLFINGLGPSTKAYNELFEQKSDETTSSFDFEQKFGREPTDDEQKTLDDNHNKEWIKHFQDPRWEFSLKASTKLPMNGKGTLYVVKATNGDFLAKEGGPVTINEIFKYISFMGWNFYNFNYENKGVEVRDYTSEKGMQRRKLGKKFIGELDEKGISCFHGALITPNGFYNVQTRKPTRAFPYGLKITPIGPDDFGVAKYIHIHSKKDNRKYILIK